MNPPSAGPGIPPGVPAPNFINEGPPGSRTLPDRSGRHPVNLTGANLQQRFQAHVPGAGDVAAVLPFELVVGGGVQ